MLKEAAQFFLDYMVVHPENGRLIAGPSESPENKFLAPDGTRASYSMSPTCDSVLIHDLFTYCTNASQILEIDSAFRTKLEGAIAKLPPLQIGKHGHLMEWLEDYEDTIPNHRHMTHLIALYPSDRITVEKAPELAEAARATIKRRVNRDDWEDVARSRANLISFYARLQDANMAHESIRVL